MHTKVLITGFLIAFGTLIGVQHPPEITGNSEDLTQVYESSIDTKIEKCEMQADLLYTSKSVTLRNYADLQAKKAEFFDFEKDMLINMMVQTQLEPKHYKIEHFLEEQFYRYIGK